MNTSEKAWTARLPDPIWTAFGTVVHGSHNLYHRNRRGRRYRHSNWGNGSGALRGRTGILDDGLRDFVSRSLEVMAYGVDSAARYIPRVIF